MVATPARIGFVIRAYRRATSESPDVAARHGTLARESADPLDTWFSSVADAQERADERQALLEKERRLFTVTLTDVGDEVLELLDGETVPTIRFIDGDRDVDMMAIATEIVVDAEAHTAQLTIWG